MGKHLREWRWLCNVNLRTEVLFPRFQWESPVTEPQPDSVNRASITVPFRFPHFPQLRKFVLRYFSRETIWFEVNWRKRLHSAAEQPWAVTIYLGQKRGSYVTAIHTRWDPSNHSRLSALASHAVQEEYSCRRRGRCRYNYLFAQLITPRINEYNRRCFTGPCFIRKAWCDSVRLDVNLFPGIFPSLPWRNSNDSHLSGWPSRYCSYPVRQTIS